MLPLGVLAGGHALSKFQIMYS